MSNPGDSNKSINSNSIKPNAAGSVPESRKRPGPPERSSAAPLKVAADEARERVPTDQNVGKFVSNANTLSSKMSRTAATAVNIANTDEYGMRDVTKTSEYFRQLSQDIDKVSKLYEQIAEAKLEQNGRTIIELEKKAKEREAAITVALDAQTRVNRDRTLQNLLAGTITYEAYGKIAAETNAKITALREKPRPTTMEYAEEYLNKAQEFVNKWEEIIPSWEGIALTGAAVAFAPGTIAAGGALGLVQGYFNAGPTPRPPGAVLTLASDAVGNRAVQVGSLIGLTYLIAVYGRGALNWTEDVYNTIQGALGELVNQAVPLVEGQIMQLGIAGHGSSDYLSSKEEQTKLDEAATAILTPDQIANVAEASKTTVPGMETTGTTGAQILASAAGQGGDLDPAAAQQQVASVLDEVASRAPSRQTTPENSQNANEFWKISGGGRRKSRSTKRRRGTKRRGTKRRGTKRRGTKRRGTRRRGLRRR